MYFPADADKILIIVRSYEKRVTLRNWQEHGQQEHASPIKHKDRIIVISKDVKVQAQGELMKTNDNKTPKNQTRTTDNIKTMTIYKLAAWILLNVGETDKGHQ